MLKIKLQYKILIYLLGLFLVIGYGYYKTEKFDVVYTSMSSIIFIFYFCLIEIYAPWAEKKDISSMLELLSKKYNSNRKIGNNTIEINFKERVLRLTATSHRGTSTPLSIFVYLDVSNYDNTIIDKLKIHFYCNNVDNKDWVCLTVGSNSIRPKTIKFLVNESENTIEEVISKTDKYVEKIAFTNKT